MVGEAVANRHHFSMCGRVAVGPPKIAPPISYSVNGKQYVAVLVGARQPANILQNLPELRNTSTASMLFVFSL
jgi:hypothetical protein